MTQIDWMVLAIGLAIVVWVNWYFFFSTQRSARATAAASGAQEILITVRGGYDPAVISLTAGTPVRLRFDRQETSGCSEEVVFPDLGIRKFLPAFQETVIEIGDLKAGRYEFTCGMSMLHGALVVE